MEISVFIQNTRISNFELRYLFNADISAVRSDISSVLTKMSGFGVNNILFAFHYKYIYIAYIKTSSGSDNKHWVLIEIISKCLHGKYR